MDLFQKNRFFGWLVFLLIIMNISLLAIMWFHQMRRPSRAPHFPPRHFHDEKPGDVQRFLDRELDLSGEQARRFEELRREHAEGAESINRDIHELRGEMTAELFNDDPDTAKVGRLADAIGEKQAELERFLFDHFIALKSICDPRQREKFDTLVIEILEMIKPKGSPPPPRGKKPPPRHRG